MLVLYKTAVILKQLITFDEYTYKIPQFKKYDLAHLDINIGYDMTTQSHRNRHCFRWKIILMNSPSQPL